LSPYIPTYVHFYYKYDCNNTCNIATSSTLQNIHCRIAIPLLCINSGTHLVLMLTCMAYMLEFSTLYKQWKTFITTQTKVEFKVNHLHCLLYSVAILVPST